MTRWAMVADLERCVGCQTCVAACRHTNATSPAVQWRKVLDVEAGNFPNVSRTFVPVGCQHCEDPPCMHVCPTTATRQRADGIVTIDYDICIGCAYCDVACPYQARFKIDELQFAYDTGPMQNETEREDLRMLGVAQKCTFCSDRIDFGLENDLTPGLDPRATPACVNSCIADALHFGDIDDPNSNVSRLLREQKHFRMHEELGTAPGFYYAYGKANEGNDPPPALESPAAPAPAGRIRTRGVEPWHQQHWDWKAAANFLCGGAGTGLFAFVAFADAAQTSTRLLGLVALGLVGLGLLLLLFKIGRPLRFIYVLRQPQRSWMAREAWIAGLFFPLAMAAIWYANTALMSAAAAVGLVFLYCQGMILKEAKGIPAWREPRIVPLIVATGLTEGGGLFLAAIPLAPALGALANTIAIAVIVLAAVRAWLWRSYFAALERAGAPTRALEALARLRIWFFLFGLAGPLLLIALGFVVPMLAREFFAIGGLSAFAAGWVVKFTLVTRAGYNQGFALPHTPIRGTGIPGPAIKPGWSLPSLLGAAKRRRANVEVKP
jgi:phenylacetyl-CoA:acceptor oxidoreductase subunit 1